MYNGLNDNGVGQNFHAVKIGDVNSSATVNVQDINVTKVKPKPSII
ncbi:MAG: hypothetical protein IPN86_23845 [Saprospiraceae bacterium]|nr:hypothetical protein [Saprospiraceae bacterium]